MKLSNIYIYFLFVLNFDFGKAGTAYDIQIKTDLQ